MKVLFAVSNEKISEQIVKTYQKEYKEIISSKNVYYFNAIQKELQKNNTYDRIVISEDLEPFANNNYDAMDKFIFDKLDAISDEATNSKRNDTPIILICSDRREKSEEMLVKLFSIGVYDAVIGNDRSIGEICKLIRKPRTKKEAKLYYKIDSEDAKYETESNSEVSEVEIQNILNYYKKLGRNEDKFAEGFENIASQYNEEQLKLIANILPLNVKAVLESTSPTYQKIMTASVSKYIKEQEESGLSVNFIKDKKAPSTGNIIVPSSINKNNVRRVVAESNIRHSNDNLEEKNIDEEEKVEEQAPKRRGRPRKNPLPEENVPKVPKRRGRPRKNPIPEEKIEEVNNVLEDLEPINLFDMSDEMEKNKTSEEITTLPGFEELDNIQEENIVNSKAEESNNIENVTYENKDNVQEITNTIQNVNNEDIQNLLTINKKIVAFVGTSKNGTSFLVNNVAESLSKYGINIALLDTTRNRNSYYIYTKNEEELRRVASNSIKDLQNGNAQGIKVNENLTVYTAIPEEKVGIENYNQILKTLIQYHDLVLIDTDFRTNWGYFKEAQEIYLVQSLDVLTIQPLTAFLRDLKAKGILEQEKLRIVINKTTRVRGLTDKAIIGGMSFYNEPSMSFMTELFNRDTVRYCSIPFEERTYSKYLEGLVNCNISLNGYSKIFMQSLQELNNMIYPLIDAKPSKRKKEKKQKKEDNDTQKFSQGMSDTLNQMKKNY